MTLTFFFGIVILILFSFVLYPVIKLAVKNGVISAYEEIKLQEGDKIKH